MADPLFVDWTFARHILDPARPVICPYTIEFGPERPDDVAASFHPPYAELLRTVVQVAPASPPPGRKQGVAAAEEIRPHVARIAGRLSPEGDGDGGLACFPPGGWSVGSAEPTQVVSTLPEHTYELQCGRRSADDGSVAAALPCAIPSWLGRMQ